MILKRATSPRISARTVVHCVGPRMRALHRALPEAQRGMWFEDANALAAEVFRMIDAGDVVLIKGSKGSKVSLAVEALRKKGRANRPEARDD